jgi:DNA (cytosine-5)-methyltransferase 1
MHECGTELTAVSLFDGIGGFPRALASAGIRTVATCEIDPAAAGVAADHFPEAKAFTDVTELTADELLAAGFCPRCGVVTGGWPCQDLSLAGRRLGLGGARSGLFFEVVRLVADLRPRWLVLENVPGLLSAVCSCPGLGVCGTGCGDPHPVRGGLCGSRGGRGGRCMEIHGGAMGAVLGALGELGYGLAYRVLDAQHFGVPQRRRRIVIVGCLGDWAAPAAVLLEPEGSGGDPAPGTAPGAGAAGVAGGSADITGGVANALTKNMAGGGGGADDNTAQGGHLITVDPQAWQHRTNLGPMGTMRRGNGNVTGGVPFLATRSYVPLGGQGMRDLTAEGSDASEDGTGRGTPIIAFGHTNGLDEQASGSATPTLRAGHGVGGGSVMTPDATAAAVRRLTPVECERLQGYPDCWTATSGGREQSDSARYRQLGNSIAVPVFAWVARRLVACENR